MYSKPHTHHSTIIIYIRYSIRKCGINWSPKECTSYLFSSRCGFWIENCTHTQCHTKIPNCMCKRGAFTCSYTRCTCTWLHISRRFYTYGIIDNSICLLHTHWFLEISRLVFVQFSFIHFTKWWKSFVVAVFRWPCQRCCYCCCLVRLFFFSSS